MSVSRSNEGSEEFAGQVIWVLGAGGDIGRGIAAELTAKGAIVVGSSRRPKAAEVDQSNKGSPPWHRWVNVDVRNLEDLDAALDTIVADFGRIDAVVVSTTLPIFGDFLDLGTDAWFEVLDTKLLGSIRVIQAAAPRLIARGGGRIVLITGTARGNIPALKHWPGSTANVALNFLVNGMSARFAPEGVRINAVAPGPIESERLATMATLSDRTGTTHLQRSGTPRDVAEAVAFLLSTKADFITGSVVNVDGGGRFPI